MGDFDGHPWADRVLPRDVELVHLIGLGRRCDRNGYCAVAKDLRGKEVGGQPASIIRRTPSKRPQARRGYWHKDPYPIATV